MTDDDSRIILALSRRILAVTIKTRAIEPRRTLGAHWPDAAYLPSQRWFASLNL